MLALIGLILSVAVLVYFIPKYKIDRSYGRCGEGFPLWLYLLIMSVMAIIGVSWMINDIVKKIP
jgi:hypothetical protein